MTGRKAFPELTPEAVAKARESLPKRRVLCSGVFGVASSHARAAAARELMFR